jgi:exopolysaccharide biosynthesis polyprenyl glycosylphosphotransferase
MDTLAKPTPGIATTTSRVTQWRLLKVALVLGDTLGVVVGFILAYKVRFELGLQIFQDVTPSPIVYTWLFLSLLPLWLVIFALFGLYDRRHLLGGTEEYARVFHACTLSVMLVIAADFLTLTLVIARGWLLMAWLLSFLMVGGLRFGLRRIIYKLRQRGYFLTTTIIVGANEEGLALSEQLRNWQTSGLYVVGFVGDTLRPRATALDSLPLLGQVDDLEQLIKEYGVEELVIATTALSREALLQIFEAYGVRSDVQIRMSSGLFEIMTTGVQVKELAYVPLVSINKVRLTGLDVLLKTVLDYGLTVPGLIVISPLLLLIALVVRLDSPGPVIYRRQVLGIGGRQFDAFKFRTMRANHEPALSQNPAIQQQFKLGIKPKNDPRITKIGRLLRKYSLDELPQLVNVLKGDMSLVGPRMITSEEQGLYGKWGMNLLTVKPGITGLWQVSGRSDVSYEERVRLDMWYIRNYTIWLDLQIILQTIPAVLRGKGAY